MYPSVNNANAAEEKVPCYLNPVAREKVRYLNRLREKKVPYLDRKEASPGRGQMAQTD